MSAGRTLSRVATLTETILLSATGAITIVWPAQAGVNSALPPLAGGTFVGFGVDANLDTSSFGRSAGGNVLPWGAFTLGYDVATDTYAIRHNASSAIAQSFGPTMLRSSDGAYLTYSSVPTYQIGTGSRNTVLTLLRNVSGNTAIDLSFTSYAIGYTQSHNGVGSDTTGGFGGVFGQVANPAALPHTGAAYYAGIVDGYTQTTRISGTGDLIANFYSGEIATGMNLTAGGSFLGHVDGRGSIGAGSSGFSGDLFGSGNSYLGRFTGGFFGPLSEAGYGFFLTSGGGATEVAGIFVGKQAALPGGGPATPAPAGSTNANATLVGPLLSDTFSTFAGRLMQNAAGQALNFYTSGGTSVSKQLDLGAIVIRYDATTASYTVTDGSKTATATPANRTGVDGSLISYSTSAGLTPGDNLKFFISEPSNPYLQLTYLSYGLWSDDRTRLAQNSYRAFIFGIETPVANVPRSGAALYNGAVDGYRIENGANYRLQGSDGSILANFYTGEVRTTMRLAGTNPAYQTSPAELRIDGYGSIAAGTSRFSGALATADASYSGTFQGGFYGPAVNEAGLSFVLEGPSGQTSVNGVLVATRVPLP